MAYLGSTPSTFQRNRNWLMNGEEETPEFDLSNDIRIPGGEPEVQRRSITTNVPQEPRVEDTSQVQPQVQDTVEYKPPAPLPSYQRTGSLTERLFSPIKEGASSGQESLTSAAQMFSQEAGPSRTYESTGVEGTLRDAYQEGRAPEMEEARSFLGARYEGPQGLDQGAVTGLQKLTQDLQTRQRALSTGGGLQTLIGQSVAGLTPGQARFEAQRRLPEARVQARDLGFQEVAPLVSRLLQERRDAEAFADQRAAEEADIAERSRGFLTGERGGISDAIQALMDDRAAQQAEAEQSYADILAATPDGRLDVIRDASPYLVSTPRELPPGEFDVSDDIRLPPETGSALAESFFTPAMQDKAAAEALFNEIMSAPRYASIDEYDPLKLGVTNRAKQFYNIADEEGNIQDIRQVVGDKAVRQLLYDRQAELEAAFDPHRGARRPFSRTPGEDVGEDFSTIRPLYFGDEEFQPLDPVEYLGFDPGLRPSRENTSTEVQRDQFNRINDLLDEMDRIAESGETFRAAQIFADANKYVEDEAASLEGRKEELTDSAKEWAGQVKKLRKKYRKKKREAEYARIGAVIGTIVGTYTPLSAVGGGLWGGPAGAAIGKELA